LLSLHFISIRALSGGEKVKVGVEVGLEVEVNVEVNVEVEGHYAGHNPLFVK
jgi:hypothetical protein